MFKHSLKSRGEGVRRLGLGLLAAALFAAGLGFAPRADAAEPPSAIQIVSGHSHSCALLSDGRVRCWGGNSSGAVGDGTTTNKQSAVPVAGLTKVKRLTAGGSYTCAITTETTGGNTYCWGSNDYGQLGDGTRTKRLRPVKVASTAIMSDLDAGWTHTCASSHGSLSCWGQNNAGQLGLGDTFDRVVPVKQKAPLDRVVQFSAGAFDTCAQTNNTLSVAPAAIYCTGANKGAWGNGSKVGNSNWVGVGTTDYPRVISVGAAHRCDTLAVGDGLAGCYGDNSFGQLGGPVVQGWGFSLLSGSYAKVSAGYFHTCAYLSSARGYRCWGGNWSGQIGDGSKTDRPAPTAVLAFAGGAAAASIAAGTNTTCAVAYDSSQRQSVYCWGSDWGGALGNGLGGDSSRPMKVVGL